MTDQKDWQVTGLWDEVIAGDDRLVVVTVARTQREGAGGLERAEWRLPWTNHLRPQAARTLRRAKCEGLLVMIPANQVTQATDDYDDSSEEDGEMAAREWDGPDNDDESDEDDLGADVMDEDDLRKLMREEIGLAIAQHELRAVFVIGLGLLGPLLLACLRLLR